MGAVANIAPATVPVVEDTLLAVAAPGSEWVGQVATICDESGRNHVLLPITEEILEEAWRCESSQDALGISLLVAAEKLLVNCGTRVQVLDASNAALGCKVRILAANS